MDGDDGNVNSNSNLTIEWLWIIEYLASSGEVDASVLHDLIESAPELPEDIGRNMREMVALKCLEELFGPSNGMTNDVPSNMDSKVSFDLSESCQEVLQCILRETSVSDLKAGGPALLKWDVCPFIMHKRASLPKCGLQQLKEKIVQGTHPDAALKECSGLVCVNESDRISVDHNELDLITCRTEVRGNETQIMMNGNLISRDESNNMHLTPSKRDRSGLETENLVEHIHGGQDTMNSFDDINVNMKKLRHDTSTIDPSVGQCSLHPQGEEFVESCSKRVVRATEVKENDLQKSPRDRGLERSKLPVDGSKRSGRSSDVGSESLHYDQMEVHYYNTNRMPQDKSVVGCIQLGMEDRTNDAEQRTLNGAPSIRTGYGDSADEPSDNRGLEGSKLPEGHSERPGQSSDAETEKVVDYNTIRMPQDMSADGCIQLGMVDGAEDVDQRTSNGALSIRTGHKDPADEPNDDRGLEGSKLPEVHSKRPGQSTNVETEKEVDYNINRMPQDTSVDGYIQLGMVDEADDAEQRTLNGAPAIRTGHEDTAGEPNDNGDHDFQPKSLNDELDGIQEKINPGGIKGGSEHIFEEMSDGSGEHHDERIDIAQKKSCFLNSQFLLSQNSLATADFTEQTLCVKCSDGGQLLVCSTSSCPLVVHENCLGFPAKFDDKGNFYCPFCVYSQAISEYLEAKRKASLARKELAAFVHMGLNHQPEDLNMRSVRKEHGQIGYKDLGAKDHEDRDLGGAEHNNQNRQHVNDVNDCHAQKDIDGKQKSEPSAICVNVDLPRVEEANAVGGKDCVSTGENEEDMTVQEADPRWDGDDQSCKEVGGGIQREECTEAEGVQKEVCMEAEAVVQKEALQQQITDPKEKPVCALHIDGEESSESEDDKFIISKYFIRHRSRETHYTYPSTPQLRRKKVPWTGKEEEMLKKGVRKFSNVHDRTIPWKKILEFGGSVFLSDRTPMDLKDKWRNMCKGSPRSV